MGVGDSDKNKKRPGGFTDGLLMAVFGQFSKKKNAGSFGASYHASIFSHFFFFLEYALQVLS